MRDAVAGAARVAGWPFRMALLGLIRFYRWGISPLLGPRCKYYPTCSAYALHAVEAHGAGKGSLLASWRLLRCNPFSKGGYDPIPGPGNWLPDVLPDGRPRRARIDGQLPAHSSASKEA